MGFEQLVEIFREQVEERDRSRSEPLVDCPNDGEPLTDTGRELHCGFCGRTYGR